MITSRQMVSKNPNITPENLREFIVANLEKRGKTPDFIAGYVEAMDLAGYTAKGKPAWIRNSAALLYLIPISPAAPEVP